MPIRLGLAVLLAAASVAPAADTWPEFRSAAGNGASDAKGVPTKWRETENVRWKVPVHDKGCSSPVVWKDQVWVTTAHEKGRKVLFDDDGIVVQDEKGNSVKIDSNANAITIEAVGNLKIKAAAITIEATGTLDVKAIGKLGLRGALVNIN